jgi:hypothetical protein
MSEFDLPSVMPGSRKMKVLLYDDMGLDNPALEELFEAKKEFCAWLRQRRDYYKDDKITRFYMYWNWNGFTGEFGEEFLLEIRQRREVYQVTPNERLILFAAKGDEERKAKFVMKKKEALERLARKHSESKEGKEN